MNILFTCAGRRTYLLKYFKENLSEGDKIVATDMQLSAPALQVADVKIQVPAVYDPEYVNITLRICEEQKIDALFSLSTLTCGFACSPLSVRYLITISWLAGSNFKEPFSLFSPST